MRRVGAAIGASSIVLICAQAMAEPTISASTAPLLETAHDQLVSRAYVPSPQEIAGEVRLLRRGEAEVVQTLLYTTILRRVVGEIRKKEIAGWAPDSAGYDDSQRYVEALTRAQQEIWKRFRELERGADRRQKLLIEFILSRDTAAVLLAEYDMKDGEDGVVVTARRTLTLLEPSRHYVHRNMRLIVADSFKIPEAELASVLSTLPLMAAPE